MASNQPPPIPPELAVGEEPFDPDTLTGYAEWVADASPGSIPSRYGYPELDADDDDPYPEVRRWRVEDDGAAEWAMRHLASAEMDAAGIGRQAAEWRQRITEWEGHRTASLTARAAFFRHHLEDYALRRREADPRAKTLNLPSGIVRTTIRKPAVVVEDEQKLLSWATAELDSDHFAAVVKVVESVRVSELRKIVAVVEVTDSVTLDCGCMTSVTPDACEGLPVGAAVTCPQCGATATVAAWGDRWLAAVGRDGLPVPGAGVADESVSATVTAEAP